MTETLSLEDHSILICTFFTKSKVGNEGEDRLLKTPTIRKRNISSSAHKALKFQSRYCFWIFLSVWDQGKQITFKIIALEEDVDTRLISYKEIPQLHGQFKEALELL